MFGMDTSPHGSPRQCPGDNFILVLLYVINGLMTIFRDVTTLPRFVMQDSPDIPQLLKNNVSKSENWGGGWKMFYINKKYDHVHIKENCEVSKDEMGPGKNKNERVKSEKDVGICYHETRN